MVLIPLALFGFRHWFLGAYIVLGFSDLVDGMIARRMHQRSSLGAKLDTYADAMLNSCLIVGVLILCWDQVSAELYLIGAAVASYLISCLFCWWKFSKLPAYHSYLAKISQFMVAVASISLLLDFSIWPLRRAAVLVLLTNMEGILITAKLVTWKEDVVS